MPPPTQSKWKERLVVTVFALALLLAPLSKDIAAADKGPDKGPDKWEYPGGTENNSKTFIVQDKDSFSFTVDKPGKDCELPDGKPIEFKMIYPGKEGKDCISEVTVDKNGLLLKAEGAGATAKRGGDFGKNTSVTVSVKGRETSVDTGDPAKTCVPNLVPFGDPSHSGYNLTMTLINTTKMPEGCSIVLHFPYDEYSEPTPPPTTQPQQTTTPTSNSTGDKPLVPGPSCNSTTDGCSGKVMLIVGIATGVGLVMLCTGCLLGWFAFKCIRAENIQEEGFDEGFKLGQSMGKDEGFAKGKRIGFKEGHKEGRKEEQGRAFDEQLDHFAKGREEGEENGKFDDPHPIPEGQFKEIDMPITREIAE